MSKSESNHEPSKLFPHWPLVHTPAAEVVVSEDLRGKGVEVNFRRALLEQCQVPRVALCGDGFSREVGHSW